MEQSKKKSALFIIGGSSTALEMREIVDVYYSNEYVCVYNVIGDYEESGSLSNVITDSQLQYYLSQYEHTSFILGFSNINLRKSKREECRALGAEEVNIIHPQSYIAKSARLGNGVYVGPFAVISSNAQVLDGCMINIGVSIGHDCILGEDCCLNPGARISGHVQIGDNTLVGANSCIFQGLSVGANCAIDAMTFIERNIDDKQMCTNRMGTLKIYKNRV